MIPNHPIVKELKWYQLLQLSTQNSDFFTLPDPAVAL